MSPVVAQTLFPAASESVHSPPVAALRCPHDESPPANCFLSTICCPSSATWSTRQKSSSSVCGGKQNYRTSTSWLLLLSTSQFIIATGGACGGWLSCFVFFAKQSYGARSGGYQDCLQCDRQGQISTRIQS